MELTHVEDELRAHLHSVTTPRAPGDLTDAVRARHRSQRRQQAAVVGIGLAVALVFGSVPVLRGIVPDAPATEDVAAPPRTSVDSLYDLAPRGALAGDPDWAPAVAALPWDTAGLPEADPPADSRRVVYAADVPGARVALVAGHEGTRSSATWFTGPTGAPPEQMVQTTGSQRLLRGQPVLLLVDPPQGAPGSLVLVGFPGDTLEYVDGRTVTASGQEEEQRRSVATDDGIAVADVSPRPGRLLSLETTVRTADGDVRSTEGLGSTGNDPSPVLLEDLQDPRGLRARVTDEVLETVLQAGDSHYGTGLDGGTAVLLAAGPVGGSGGEMALIGYTFSSGATGLWVGRADPSGPDGSYTASVRTGSPSPAGTPVTEQVLAVPLAAGDLALSGPPEAVAAQVLDTDGALLTTLPLDGGTGVGQTPPPAADRVRFLDSTGAPLAEVPVSELAG